MSTYGGSTYGGSPTAPVESLHTSAHLSFVGALRHVEPPAPTALRGQSVLDIGEPVVGRMGGSVASVAVRAFGLGTKVLAGSTARVAVVATAAGSRVPPYLPHPNTREDSNLVPHWDVALASFLRDEEQEPPSGEGRQLVMLSSARSTVESEQDPIFDVDHRG